MSITDCNLLLLPKTASQAVASSKARLLNSIAMAQHIWSVVFQRTGAGFFHKICGAEDGISGQEGGEGGGGDGCGNGGVGDRFSATAASSPSPLSTDAAQPPKTSARPAPNTHGVPPSSPMPTVSAQRLSASPLPGMAPKGAEFADASGGIINGITPWMAVHLSWLDMLQHCEALVENEKWLEGLSVLAECAGELERTACRPSSSASLNH